MQLRSVFCALALSTSLVTTALPAQELDELVSAAKLELDGYRIGGFVEIAELQTVEAYEALMQLERMMELPQSRARIAGALEAFVGTESEEAAREQLLDWALDKEPLLAEAAACTLAEYGAPGLAALERVARRSREEHVRAVAIGSILKAQRGQPSVERVELVLAEARIPASGGRQDLSDFFARVAAPVAAEHYRDWLVDRRLPLGNRMLLLEDAAERPEPVLRPVLDSCFELRGAPDLQARALEIAYDRDLVPPVAWLDRFAAEVDEPAPRWMAEMLRARALADEPRWQKEVQEFAASDQLVEQVIAGTVLVELPAAQRQAVVQALFREEVAWAPRAAALESIARLRQPELLGPVVGSLARADPVLFERTRQCLVTLTRRTDLEDAQAWQSWWTARANQAELRPASQQFSQWRFRSDWSVLNEPPDGTLFGLQPVTRRVVFVIDASTEMQRLVPVRTADGAVRITSQELVRRHLAAALEALPAETEVRVVLFNDEVRSLSNGWMELGRRTRARIDGELGQVLARDSGVAIEAALREAFAHPDADCIVLLSAADPGPEAQFDPDYLRSEVTKWNRFRRVSIHTVALHREWEFLTELARKNGGRTVLAR